MIFDLILHVFQQLVKVVIECSGFGSGWLFFGVGVGQGSEEVGLDLWWFEFGKSQGTTFRSLSCTLFCSNCPSNQLHANPSSTRNDSKISQPSNLTLLPSIQFHFRSLLTIKGLFSILIRDYDNPMIQFLLIEPTPMFSLTFADLDDFFLPAPDCSEVPESNPPQESEKRVVVRLQDLKKSSKKKHWKAHENLKYIQFLRQNKDLFDKDREDKRLMKINMMMSKSVRTKNATQCRSHHQKMLMHYKTIDNIILSLGEEKADQPDNEGECGHESNGHEEVSEQSASTRQEEPKCGVNEDLSNEYQRWFTF